MKKLSFVDLGLHFEVVPEWERRTIIGGGDGFTPVTVDMNNKQLTGEGLIDAAIYFRQNGAAAVDYLGKLVDLDSYDARPGYGNSLIKGTVSINGYTYNWMVSDGCGAAKMDDDCFHNRLKGPDQTFHNGYRILNTSDLPVISFTTLDEEAYNDLEQYINKTGKYRESSNYGNYGYGPSENDGYGYPPDDGYGYTGYDGYGYGYY